MPLRASVIANAFKQIAGLFAPLSKITASMSELGRYMPVANEPCTSKRAAGQMDLTTARTRSTAAARAVSSSSVGSKNLPKSTISLCKRMSGDCKLRNRFTVPGGHHRGFSFGSKCSCSSSSSGTSSDFTAAALALPGSFLIGA